MVQGFFARPSAAIIKLKRALQQGDRIYVKGHTTDLQQVVESMQINHQDIAQAKRGQVIGVQVASRVRPNDVVYLMSRAGGA